LALILGTVSLMVRCYDVLPKLVVLCSVFRFLLAQADEKTAKDIRVVGIILETL